jgi:hypothetical protein
LLKGLQGFALGHGVLAGAAGVLLLAGRLTGRPDSLVKEGTEFVPFAGGLGANPADLGGVAGAQLFYRPGGVFPGPRSLSAGILSVRLGGRRTLAGILDVFLMLFSLLAHPVALVFCGADAALSLRADLAGQFLGPLLGLGYPGLGRAYRGVGLSLRPSDCPAISVGGRFGVRVT